MHTTDTDCTVSPITDCCTECGVLHGEPCTDCGGRGFHLDSCPRFESDDPVCERCGLPASEMATIEFAPFCSARCAAGSTTDHTDGLIACTACATPHAPRGTRTCLDELGDCGRTAARDGWECADCGATLLDRDVWASLDAMRAEDMEATC